MAKSSEYIPESQVEYDDAQALSFDSESAPSMFDSAAYLASHPVGHSSFDRFVATIAALRAPDGCPWDREQTHASLAHNMIEEAYEAVDAIEKADSTHLREELGDVLLQVVLHSQIASDAEEFTLDDVCAEVNAKIVRRHPHVFGDASARDAAAVLNLWDQVKLAEKEQADCEVKKAQSTPCGLLDSVPCAFPALMQAQKISRKAAAVGFEWDSLENVWDKVFEEIAELRAAYDAAPKGSGGKVCAQNDDTCAVQLAEAVEMELGDVFFSLVNVGRHMGIDAESALRSACAKFRRRWSFMEAAADEDSRRIEDMSSDELEALWNKAKNMQGIG